MNPTIFMAWLSTESPREGGWWTEQARQQRDHRDWSKAAPLHLSFHTSEEAAKLALSRACQQEWLRSDLAYSYGPWGDDIHPINTMTRFCGYEAHVTEQVVHLDAEPEPRILDPAMRERMGRELGGF